MKPTANLYVRIMNNYFDFPPAIGSPFAIMFS